MSNVTAEAPVRANKAPARAKAAQRPGPINEAGTLVAQVAIVIGDLLKAVVESPFTDDYQAKAAFQEADALLIALAQPAGPNDYWDESKPRKAVGEQILAIDGHLEEALTKMLDDEFQQPGAHLFRLTLAEQASALLSRLHAAYQGLPGTMAELRALTTTAGIRPHRDRPQPPIRRVFDDDANELLRTAVCLGDLVQWICGARETLAVLSISAENHPQFRQDLLKYDIPWSHPEWDLGRAGDAMDFILNEQHLAIKALGAKAGAA